MGNESTCTARFGKKKLTGQALLETSELLFRPTGGSQRMKIPFSTIKSAKATDGELRLQTTDGPAVFVLGPTAEKWCHRILHPKTRVEKLGLKAGASVSLLGSFDQDFLKELRATTKNIQEDKIDAVSDLIFLGVDSRETLSASLIKTTKTIKGATAVWIVYPKGKKEVTENEVIATGRKSGLKDVKVVGFSATHTALKFVLPLSSR
jgi:hypothetical protein